jgi:hypothetical protein
MIFLLMLPHASGTAGDAIVVAKEAANDSKG